MKRKRHKPDRVVKPDRVSGMTMGTTTPTVDWQPAPPPPPPPLIEVDNLPFSPNWASKTSGTTFFSPPPPSTPIFTPPPPLVEPGPDDFRHPSSEDNTDVNVDFSMVPNRHEFSLLQWAQEIVAVDSDMDENDDRQRIQALLAHHGGMVATHEQAANLVYLADALQRTLQIRATTRHDVLAQLVAPLRTALGAIDTSVPLPVVSDAKKDDEEIQKLMTTFATADVESQLQILSVVERKVLVLANNTKALRERGKRLENCISVFTPAALVSLAVVAQLAKETLALEEQLRVCLEEGTRDACPRRVHGIVPHCIDILNDTPVVYRRPYFECHLCHREVRPPHLQGLVQMAGETPLCLLPVAPRHAPYACLSCTLPALSDELHAEVGHFKQQLTQRLQDPGDTMRVWLLLAQPLLERIIADLCFH